MPVLLKGRAPATLLLISNELDKLALWANKFGAHRVLEGDPAGWQHLRSASDFQGWSLRIYRYEHARARAQGRLLPVPLLHGELSRCFAQAVALRNDRLADWCGRTIVRELRAPTGFLSDWRHTPLHFLMAWLYLTWREGGVRMDARRLRHLGVYRPIVTSWTDDGALGKALVRACDYHCARTDPDVDADPEFWHNPFDVFPGEILALMRVRRDLLASEVTVTHPLLSSPLASAPDDIPHRSEPLLRRVAARVRRAEKRLLGKNH